MSWFGQAAGLEDVAAQMQKQPPPSPSAPPDGPSDGVVVAPGVKFSEKLWTRLGGQLQESEKQRQREKMSSVTAFPDIPPSLFDATFRRDAVWKQRELRLRKGYVEHLESLQIQRTDDAQTLQDKVLDQVAGVYKLAEEEAVGRLAKHTEELQLRAQRLRPTEAPCSAQSAAVVSCYNANSANPLACAEAVSLLEKCAAAARKEAVKRIKPVES
eukprot:CAMPEP_0173418666 /NCGR_PEP_ID=MMETSP1357-20121228/746_1 /TAXON_ID=77926 /ORGANISM="Hemiselmis rufescens, Strain PCC563" /LENGTH=213 /DNA_ID=CAMNT_0014381193 /DNA_START=144 /DNA_END=785 /DNA_ORIENTATION=+